MVVSWMPLILKVLGTLYLLKAPLLLVMRAIVTKQENAFGFA